MQRYQRNVLCEGFSAESQQRLFSSSVLVVGAGGLGSVVLRNLAQAGVGRIGIFEFDSVSISNLQRQGLYTESDLSKSKAQIAKARLLEINSELVCELFEQKFTYQNGITIAGGYDIIVDCTDNYEARYCIDAVSKELSIPFVYGSVQNLEGQVSTFNHNGSMSYSDLFAPPQTSLPIVGVLTPMPSIVGAVQALEAIKILTKAADNLVGSLWLFNGTDYTTTIFNFGNNDE